MAERRLVLDANILIRAVLGTRVRELIERHSAAVAMIAPDAAFADREPAARPRIGIRDMNDWPVVASALVLDCPIWTEDRDFFGSGVPTWTIDRVELYLAG